MTDNEHPLINDEPIYHPDYLPGRRKSIISGVVALPVVLWVLVVRALKVSKSRF